jgi:EmrB/QacA subfamily drug resistance transporter
MGRLALIVLCVADVLVALDGTVVSVALPSIQRDLHFSATGLQWVVTAYTVTLGSFLLLGGRIADAAGPRRTFVSGLAVFTAGSLVAGLARTPAVLVGARAVAGLGAALAIPAALALIAAGFRDGQERTRALGLVSAGIDVGMALGAVLGGVVTTALGWPWAFLLAVPLGAATVAVAPRVLDEQRPRRPERIDPLGAIMVATGVGSLIYGLTAAEARGVADARTLAPIVLAAAVLAGFAHRERERGAVAGGRRALAADVAIVANAGAFGGVLVLSTLHMQRVLGFSALEAGLGFVPLVLSAGAGGPAAARLVARFGTRGVVAASFVITAGAALWLAGAPVGTGYAAALLPAFAVGGFTFATAAVPLTAEAVADAAPAAKGAAAGLFQTCTHAGGAVVLAALIVCAAARSDGAAARGADATAALLAGYRLAFVLTAALLAAGALVALALLRRPAPPSPPATAP